MDNTFTARYHDENDHLYQVWDVVSFLKDAGFTSKDGFAILDTYDWESIGKLKYLESADRFEFVRANITIALSYPFNYITVYSLKTEKGCFLKETLPLDKNTLVGWMYLKGLINNTANGIRMDKIDSDDLMLCPYCGSTARYIHPYSKTGGFVKHQVVCKICEAGTKIINIRVSYSASTGEYSNEREMKQAEARVKYLWNCRATVTNKSLINKPKDYKRVIVTEG